MQIHSHRFSIIHSLQYSMYTMLFQIRSSVAPNIDILDLYSTKCLSGDAFS